MLLKLSFVMIHPYSLIAELTWSWWYHDASIIVPGDTANLWCHQWGESWHHDDSPFPGFEFNPRRVHDNLSVPLWVYMRFPVLSIKIKPTKLTHTGGEIDTSAFIPDGLSVVQCSLGHVIGIVFLTQLQWHEANVLVNWRCCFSLEVVSSIPARSMMIYRFLYGFICVARCQSIKIKTTNMHIASAGA